MCFFFFFGVCRRVDTLNNSKKEKKKVFNVFYFSNFENEIKKNVLLLSDIKERKKKRKVLPNDIEIVPMQGKGGTRISDHENIGGEREAKGNETKRQG